MAGIDDLRPLDAAIEEIRALHRAAERAADGIGAEVGQLAHGERPGAESLMAGIADALVERTEAIREDCRRLERLLERARAAVAAQPGTAASPSAPPTSPPLADIASSAGPVVPNESFEAPHREPQEPSAAWRFWRRHRGRGGAADAAVTGPARLPRPDFLAAGVDPAAEPRDRRPPARPPVPEGVRLIATQMAIAGASRPEVEQRLQRQFGIIDASEALDEIYGYTSSTILE